MKVIVAVVAVIAAILTIFVWGVLLLNRVTSPATPNAPPVPLSPPSVRITIVDGPTYVVDGEDHNLESLRSLLVKKGRSATSVSICTKVENAFAATALLFTEIKKLGIDDVRVESPNQSSEPTAASGRGSP